MRKPHFTVWRLLTIVLAIAICVVPATAAPRADDGRDTADRAARGADIGRAASLQEGPLSIHRMLRERVELILRLTGALVRAEDEPIRGNGLSDGPDPTDSRIGTEGSSDEDEAADPLDYGGNPDEGESEPQQMTFGG